MQNGVIESFNSRFRAECRNANWIRDLRHVRLVVAIRRTLQPNGVRAAPAAIGRLTSLPGRTSAFHWRRSARRPNSPRHQAALRPQAVAISWPQDTWSI